MSSLKDRLKKTLGKNEGISFESSTPKFWISTGNFVINKIMSGKYDRGIPQGRIACLTGPSGSGKSFVLANIIKQAQKDGFTILVVDTEHALDNEYMEAIGVDTEHEDYIYVSVKNMASGTKSIQTVTREYNDMRAKGEDQPPLLVVVDSLDFMFVDSMIDKFEDAGELGNDMGLQARKLKQFLTSFVQELKYINAAMLVTKQTYVDQTPNVFPPWKFAESIKYPLSQILLVTRTLDRDKKAEAREYTGIKLKVFGFKTRFTKPYQTCEIKVPYDTGMSEYEGILPVAVSFGIVKKTAGWYEFNGVKFQEGNFYKHQEAIYAEVLKRDDAIEVDEEEADLSNATEKKALEVKRERLKKLREEIVDTSEPEA